MKWMNERMNDFGLTRMIWDHGLDVTFADATHVEIGNLIDNVKSSSLLVVSRVLPCR